MRHALFVLLAAVPVVLIGWVVWRGFGSQPDEAATSGSAAPASNVRAPAGADEDATLRRLLESPVAGARTKAEVKLYDKKTLWDYINGAAPLYLERNFRRLAAAEMTAPKGGELTVDIYDMSTATRMHKTCAKYNTAATGARRPPHSLSDTTPEPREPRVASTGIENTPTHQ